VGRYGSEELALTIFLIPAILIGDRVSRRMRGYVDRVGARPFVMTLTFVAALGVLYRALS
jgi:hypothetical protein